MNILELIPKGKLWNGKNTRDFFQTIEVGIKRLQTEATKLFIECFPNTSKQLFPDWQRVCQAQTLEGVLSTLASTGGNTLDYFEQIARNFDENCFVSRDDPNNQFIAGKSLAGQNLGYASVPQFAVVFNFSIPNKIDEAEKILNKLKPAHIRFIYNYRHDYYKNNNFSKNIENI